ncbi:hypothetical protein EFL57_04685 [Weissella confusa]|uniref:hypothetical protein n=1 Tax=Weissella confusa TaxID=1583 RepID=UPI00223B5EC5|nr:hypothetical protein [Weissella confusa]MCT0009754.1 hypothetical protein [Weissella confusa]
MFEEYTGKISSMIPVDEQGNPITIATPNDDENSFNVLVNVQFFNLRTDTDYQYLLEADNGIDIQTMYGDKLSKEIADAQLKATVGSVRLNSDSITTNVKVSEFGYTAFAYLRLNNIPIQPNHARTFKIKMSISSLDEEFKSLHTAETFISLPENSYREGLPFPKPVNPFEEIHNS